MENINVKVLDEVNKGATMGMDAIHYVSDKVGDENFQKVLDVEYGKYQEISNRVNDIYNQYNYLLLYKKKFGYDYYYKSNIFAKGSRFP